MVIKIIKINNKNMNNNNSVILKYHQRRINQDPKIINHKAKYWFDR
jgi:hypothetical protein